MQSHFHLRYDKFLWGFWVIVHSYQISQRTENQFHFSEQIVRNLWAITEPPPPPKKKKKRKRVIIIKRNRKGKKSEKKKKEIQQEEKKTQIDKESVEDDLDFALLSSGETKDVNEGEYSVESGPTPTEIQAFDPAKDDYATCNDTVRNFSIPWRAMNFFKVTLKAFAGVPMTVSTIQNDFNYIDQMRHVWNISYSEPSYH